MGFEVIQGDCLEVMRGMADGSVDAVITDPPYSSGGLHIGSKRTPPADKYTSAGHWSEQKAYPDFSGDSCDQLSWMTFAHCWMAHCYRVCKTGAHFYTFCDWRQLAVAITAMQSASWQYRGVIVWDKGNTARAPYPGAWRHGAEFLLWGSKGKPWTVTEGKWLEGVAPVHNVIATNGVRDKQHMTEKPVPLVARVLNVCTAEGDLVLDPFAGSGTTGVACAIHKRNFVGIERESAYADIARRRIEEGLCRSSLFEPTVTKGNGTAASTTAPLFVEPENAELIA